MKKIMPFLFAVMCLSLSLSAQDNYYYYHHGSKIFLNEKDSKVVLITSKAGNVTMTSPVGMTLLDTIKDSRSLIRVYSLPVSSNVKRLISANSSKSLSIMPFYTTEDGCELIPNGYINVKLKAASDYSKLQIEALHKGCIIIEQNPFMPLWYNLRIDESRGLNSVDIANALYESGKFECAFPSFTLDALEISYDPDVYQQWNLYNPDYEGLDISASQAWSYATGRGVVIAIVDDGIDSTHKDLAPNIFYKSYDTETNTCPSKLYGSHGTHCAGIAAAVRNNGIQVVGVAPDAKLMSVSNTLLGLGNMEYYLANGINWAWQNGADIISCSWYCYPNKLIENAIDNAVSKGREGKGCVFVKSAGNTSGPISYPGDYSPDVLAVANMIKDGSIAPDSGRGSNLFVAAPGTGIFSTVLHNQIGEDKGTSMACPHVAGVAALVLERNPALTAVQVREIIARNAKKVGDIPYSINKIYGSWNERYGYGLVDAYNAVINTPRK